MTRELKLALIFGFSLLLVVTVLISDHLSEARDARLAADLPEAPALVPAPPREVLVASAPDAKPRTPDLNRDETSSLPVQEPDRVPQGPETLIQGSKSKVAQRDSADDDSFILPPRGTPLAGTRKHASPDQEQQPTPGGDKPGPVGDPSVSARTHTVASGETLSKIARKYYGTSNDWKRIAEANPKVIGKNGEVRVGAQITIPPQRPADGPQADPVGSPRTDISERLITGRQQDKRLPRADLPESDSAKADKSQVAKAEQSATPDPMDAKPSPETGSPKASYVVRSGDTLSEIAQRELGSAARAKDIIRLNRDAFPDGGSAVRIGMVLKLPRG